jgi:hypothetical protein
MLPSHHAAATAVAAAPMLARGRSPLRVALFAAAAVLIDVDHYLAYAWRIRDLSLRRAYWFHRNRMHHPYRLHRPRLVIDPLRPLHAPILLGLLYLLVRRQPLLESIVAWMLFHRFLDYTWSLWSFARALYHLRHPARREK